MQKRTGIQLRTGGSPLYRTKLCKRHCAGQCVRSHRHQSILCKPSVQSGAWNHICRIPDRASDRRGGKVRSLFEAVSKADSRTDRISQYGLSVPGIQALHRKNNRPSAKGSPERDCQIASRTFHISAKEQKKTKG